MLGSTVTALAVTGSPNSPLLKVAALLVTTAVNITLTSATLDVASPPNDGKSYED